MNFQTVMTRILLFLVLCSFAAWAQPDNLKPIGSDLLPSNYWNGHGWQSGVKTQYTYDGLDIRARDLGQYIMASGDANATREYNAYRNSRHAGGWLIAGGVLTAIIGTPIMLSNRPGSDGKFTTQQPYVCPTGYACGGTSGKMVYGGRVAFYQTVPDTRREKANAVGGVMLLSGAILAGIGWGMQLPGKHVRRAVQYYNRALKQQQPGISWQLQPYATGCTSGIGLVGRL